MTAQFTIGIDLGTTNTAIASAPLDDDKAAPTPFAIDQVTNEGEHEPRPLLPSFLYLPNESELPAGSLSLPWDKKRDFAVGMFARDKGSTVPGRVVSSAKSWLSHAGVDRRGPLLPVQAPVAGRGERANSQARCGSVGPSAQERADVAARRGAHGARIL